MGIRRGGRRDPRRRVEPETWYGFTGRDGGPDGDPTGPGDDASDDARQWEQDGTRQWEHDRGQERGTVYRAPHRFSGEPAPARGSGRGRGFAAARRLGQGRGFAAARGFGRARGSAQGRGDRFSSGRRERRHGQRLGLGSLLVRPPTTSEKVDSALEHSREGLRALWLTIACLASTALLQGAVTLWSGSVALLGDTVHNLASALMTLPIAVAFQLRRRPPTLRYPHGYSRAEDVAAIGAVVVIAGSAVLVGYTALDRLVHPAPIHHVLWVAVAALVGITGNELAVQVRTWIGRRIGSTALVAEGLRARIDAFTSLSVLVAAAATAFGWWWADPLVGLGLAAVLLVILRGMAAEVYLRLMDSVDPTVAAACEQALLATTGVRGVTRLQLRWQGHRLRAECTVVVNPRLTVVEAHRIAEDARYRLTHDVPKLTSAVVHAEPEPAGGDDPDAAASHLQQRGGWLG